METNNLHTDELFSKVLTGNASREEKLAFEKWVHQSDENRTVFNDYKKVWQSTEILKKYDLDKAKLMTQIKILEKLKAARGFFFYWQRAAAVLIIPILIYSAYFILSNASPNSEIVENVTTPYGARTSFHLPDGSVVWLNAGSTISYPKHFGKNREIKLNGEAYLEVQKDKKPFIVKSVYGDVKVLGTKFNVFAYENEPFRTTLVEGAVAIKDFQNSKELILEPGFQYTAQKGSGILEKVIPEMYTSWKDGKMVFRREPFGLVAKRLERWFNVSIKLEGEAIKNLWYTGTIEMETVSEVLELVKNTTPIEYSFDPNSRILIITSQ